MNQKVAVREIVDVTFKAKSPMQLGNTKFKKGEPVIYFDSAKTSSLEGNSNVVYAQGGRGNARLVAWEGDRSVTFTFEEALLSARGFAVLSGANLSENIRVNLHQVQRVGVSYQNVALDDKTPANIPVLDLTGVLPKNSLALTAADANQVNENGVHAYPDAKIFVFELNQDGEIVQSFDVSEAALTAAPTSPSVSVIAESDKADGLDITKKFLLASGYVDGETVTANPEGSGLNPDHMYLVDYYVAQPGTNLTITPGKFAGNFLIEANTLFRRVSDSRDLPAQFTIPNGKITSNFTFSMASTGDPSTFPFQVEAFPDYLPFNKKCKAVFALDIADDPVDNSEDC